MPHLPAHMSPRLFAERGQVFGRLTVIDPDARYGRDRGALVRCTCGREWVLKLTNLFSKRWPTQACRLCAQGQALVVKPSRRSSIGPGTRFGELTVVERLEGFSSPMWRAVCTCGGSWSASTARMKARGHCVGHPVSFPETSAE